jgi:hypothetical protein
LAASRFLIVIPVLGSFVAATALLIYGGFEMVQIILEVIAGGEVSSKGAKVLALTYFLSQKSKKTTTAGDD